MTVSGVSSKIAIIVDPATLTTEGNSSAPRTSPKNDRAIHMLYGGELFVRSIYAAIGLVRSGSVAFQIVQPFTTFEPVGI